LKETNDGSNHGNSNGWWLLSCFSHVHVCVTPPGSAVPGILQARTLEWVAIDGYWGLIWAECWVSLLMCLLSHFLQQLYGVIITHFTEEETESGRAVQVVRELVFAHQYIRLLSSTCNNFSRDFLIHWRERTSRMWRHVWQKVEDRALWHWGGVMTGLPQEGGEGQRLLSFLSFWHSNQLLYKVLIIRGYHLPHTIFFFFLGQEMPLLKASK